MTEVGWCAEQLTSPFILFFGIIAGIWILGLSFFICKSLKIKLHENHICTKNYSPKQLEILERVGDKRITAIYISKNVISNYSKIVLFLVSFITKDKAFCDDAKINYDLLIEKGWFHPSIVLEIEDDSKIHFIKLEKMNTIVLTDNFRISNAFCHKHTNIKHTLNDILKTTREKIGDINFFNWSINENNCQLFIKEILESAEILNDENKCDIIDETIKTRYTFDDYHWHLFYIGYNCFNFVSQINVDLVNDLMDSLLLK
tara:strand:+ start:3767 stop:4543 length:777 start_codon:yes stop_codon:yes gene_type:complete